jgi:uncharacterized protein YjlB
VRVRKPHRFWFKDDGRVPNNRRLPLVIYRGAARVPGASDPAAMFEELFARNGWIEAWRDGICDDAHFHSRTHEVLGIARGRARIRFGGVDGKDIDLRAGDIAVLPAGTGHQRLTATSDFLVVGAYPPGGQYDECGTSAPDHALALETILHVPAPEQDPVYGRNGPLRELWRA